MKIELSHDILAKKVYEKVSAEDKSLRKVERFIRDRYQFYDANHRKLTRAEINYVQPFFAKVDVAPEEEAFIEDGIAYQRRRLIIAGIILGLLFIGLLIASSTFYSLWANAEVLQMKADSAKIEAIEQKLFAESEALRADSAAKEAIEQKLYAEDQKAFAEEQQILAMQSAALASQKEREANIAAATAVKARVEAERAKEEAVEAQLNEAIEREKADSLRYIAILKARAANLLTAQSLATQSLAIEDDNDLRYVLARDAYLIHECYRQSTINGELKEWGNPNDATIYNAVYQSYRALKDEPKAFELFGATRGVVRGIIFDEDRYFYSAGSNGLLYRTPYSEDDATHVLEVGPADSILLSDGKIGRILQLVNSPNKQLLALAGEGDKLIIYDQQNVTSKAIRYREATKTQDTARSVVFLSDQHLLVAHSRTKELRIVDIAQQSFTIHDLNVKSHLIHLSFDPQKQRLAATDLDGNLYLWKLQKEASGFSFTPISIQVQNQKLVFTALCFRPNTNQLVVGSREGSVYLFGPSDGNFVQQDILWGHKGNVSALTFAQDNGQLASASFDGTIRIWDLNNPSYRKYGAKILAENYPLTTGNNPWAFSLSFSPDGHYLLCGYKNGTIKTWPLRATDLYRWTERLKSENPVDDTKQIDIWDRYVGEDINRETLLQCN